MEEKRLIEREKVFSGTRAMCGEIYSHGVRLGRDSMESETVAR